MATRAVSTIVTYRAWDTSANAPKTGDSANHTLKWIKDGTSSTTTNAGAEVDATNAKGTYKVTLTSTETDCTFGTLAGVSSTANIALFGVEIGFEYVPTAATTFGAFVGNATAAIAADASGRVDVSKIGGTSQTPRDLGASVLLSSGTGTGQLDFTAGVVKANLAQILGTALTETAGQIAAAFKKFFNIATPAATMDHLILVDTVTTYTGNTPQTGDSFARIGALGAGLTAVGDTAGTTTLLSRLTAGRALLLDNLDAAISAVPAAVWAVVIDGTNSAIKLMRGFAAAMLGKASGLNSNSPKYRNIADTKDVISATTDSDGDRTAVTLDLT